MSRRRIVIAEDATAFLQRLVSILEVDFDIVGTAQDGKSALDVIRRCDPDLVILDLGMPVLNGIEVMKALRIRPPIIVCSVETDPEILEAARQAGAIGYVCKLRVEQDLILAVESALQNQPCFLSKKNVL